MRLQSKLLSTAAEAFRYFVLEHVEAYLKAHDQAMLQPHAEGPSRNVRRSMARKGRWPMP